MTFLIANWKMHKTLSAGTELVNQLIAYVCQQPLEKLQVIILPPFTYLQTFANLLANYSNLSVGAQACHHRSAGPFTGEVSAPMVASVGADYVLVGHSERRQYNNEEGAVIPEKINQALAHNLRPIFCCGEPLEVRTTNQHYAFVHQQLLSGISHLTKEQVSQVIIAYEPIWAIGTGLVPTPDEVQTMEREMRNLLAQRYGATLAGTLPILYGGSCNAGNVINFIKLPGIQGVLVGSACLHREDFLAVIHSIQAHIKTC